MNPVILIVEDDEDLGQLLKQYLELTGFTVFWSKNGYDGRAMLKEQAFDVVLTDIMMPVEDGFTFAAEVSKTFPHMPLLFITARKMKEDIITGLKLGADDYITKPFDAEELVLRIRNILRRTSKTPTISLTYLIGQYTFHPTELVLESTFGRQMLTEREAGVLLVLCEHIGQLVKKRDILHILWKESDFFAGRSLDVFISRLRKYMAGDPRITIESIRGAGLRLMITNELGH